MDVELACTPPRTEGACRKHIQVNFRREGQVDQIDAVMLNACPKVCFRLLVPAICNDIPDRLVELTLMQVQVDGTPWSSTLADQNDCCFAFKKKQPEKVFDCIKPSVQNEFMGSRQDLPYKMPHPEGINITAL